jgi:hypothetical protein
MITKTPRTVRFAREARSDVAIHTARASRSRQAAECWFDPRYDAGVITSD